MNEDDDSKPTSRSNLWSLRQTSASPSSPALSCPHNQPSAGEGKIIMFNPQNTHNQPSAGGEQIIIFFGQIKTYKTSLQASKVC